MRLSGLIMLLSCLAAGCSDRRPMGGPDGGLPVLTFDAAMIQRDASRGADGGRAVDGGTVRPDAGVRDGGFDAGSDGGPSATELRFDLVPASATYETRMTQVDGSSLASTASSWGSAGYIVTVMETNTAGYTLLGFRPPASAITYTTRMDQVSGSMLSSTASSWAGEGYLVTAMVTNTAGYTLLGFKPTGSTTTYASRMIQVPGSSLSSTVSSWGAAGFVVTAMVTNTAGYTLLGFQPAGETTTYSTRMIQVSGSSLSSTVSSWGADGYVVTAMTTNTAGYTLLGFEPTSSTSDTFPTRMVQTTGSGLASTVSSWGSEGYVVTAMVSNTAGYTILGFQR